MSDHSFRRPDYISPEVWTELPMDIQRELQHRYIAENETIQSKVKRKRQSDNAQTKTIDKWFKSDNSNATAPLSVNDTTTTAAAAASSILDGTSNCSTVDTRAGKENVMNLKHPTPFAPIMRQKSLYKYSEVSAVAGADDEAQQQQRFIDEDFPACADSIDGRRISISSVLVSTSTTSTSTSTRKQGDPNNNSTGSSNNSDEKLCNCKMKCKLRQVYKDGPNQGRYFLSCPLRKCGFFAWADFAVHDDRVASIVWKRFGRDDGWKLAPTNVSTAAASSTAATATTTATTAGSSSEFISFSPDHILQGGVGDCWFLSAVAVLAERPDLIRNVVRDSELHPSGKVNFRLFIDGDWKNIVVDTYLPCRPPIVQAPPSASSATAGTAARRGKKKKKKKNGDIDVTTLAYSRASQDYLWVPLLEKAYAKAHGSYHAISGGHVHEALLDLTGAPCEVIDFCDDHHFDSEETWIRLLSFHASGFPMGCATAESGEGIVGGHAYSILDVKELSDITLGEQTQLEDYFKSAEDKYLAAAAVEDEGEEEERSLLLLQQQSCHRDFDLSDGDNAVIVIDAADDNDNGDDVALLTNEKEGLPSKKVQQEELLQRNKKHHYRHHQAPTKPTSSSSSSSSKVSELLTEDGHLRVLRIRNPWGKKEWQGQFGSGSEVWTSKLGKILDKGKKNDGTFWITYHDFLRRYTCIDVCKAHQGHWQAMSYDVWTKPPPACSSGGGGGHLGCQNFYIMTVLESTWMYLSLIQKTKRGRNFSVADRQYWYSALSLASSTYEYFFFSVYFCPTKNQNRTCFFCFRFYKQLVNVPAIVCASLVSSSNTIS